MHTISRRNVNDNYPDGLWHLKLEGVVEESRNGEVIVAPGPVANVYTNPRERVLFDSIRDANPYFHFFEAMWMLAGRQDVGYLAQFVKRMREFSDDGVNLGGAYGYRWRYGFAHDQLVWCANHLKDHPDSRRAIVQMYDTKNDYMGGKDIPCNTHIYFSIKHGALDMTVCCRSNDAIWGCYGANVVHMSFLQEYMAYALAVEVGRYVQFSNNFHIYTNMPRFDQIWSSFPNDENNLYTQWNEGMDLGPPLFGPHQNHMDFYHTLKDWLEHPHDESCYSFLNGVAYPMWRSFQAHKFKDDKGALTWAGRIDADDWRYACTMWLLRRGERDGSKTIRDT